MTPYVPVLYTYPRCSRHPGRQRWFMFLPDGSTIGPAIRPETLTARLAAECGCFYCTADKYARDDKCRWKCQSCGAWYPPQYLVSNEQTHRLECKGCCMFNPEPEWDDYDEATDDRRASAS